ncbi:MAG: GC-type dockerin domain-anchored protein [Planctomycetota bacterium]|nr:GC-type dockerin domain-anchored protein [Planctomycetota bacterium]
MTQYRKSAMGAAVVVVGLAGAACGQAERPMLQQLELGTEVVPLRVAPAVYADGSFERVGEWMPYSSPRGPHDVCRDYRVFDSYGDADANAVPDDLAGCDMGSRRWFFGTAYCSPFYTNDMVLADDTILSEGAWRADLAWAWTCAGFEEEQCVIAVFTQRSNPDECEPDSFDYPGWLFDFGDLDCNPGLYYRTRLDISSYGRWTLPPDAEGSYAVMFLTDDGTVLASCAQTMLWGTPDAGGTPGGVGFQAAGQMDDDYPTDYYHDPTDECYTYWLSQCPDPLGGMLQFWGERDAELWHRADFNRDDIVDSRDFIEFLNAWRHCSFGADCTGNNRCTSADVICFLDLWAGCSRE